MEITSFAEKFPINQINSIKNQIKTSPSKEITSVAENFSLNQITTSSPHRVFLLLDEFHPSKIYYKKIFVFPKFLCSLVNISLEKGGGKEKDKCRQLPKAAFLIISLGHCGHKALPPCINEPGKTFPKFYTKATVYLFNS